MNGVFGYHRHTIGRNRTVTTRALQNAQERSAAKLRVLQAQSKMQLKFSCSLLTVSQLQPHCCDYQISMFSTRYRSRDGSGNHQATMIRDDPSATRHLPLADLVPSSVPQIHPALTFQTSSRLLAASPQESQEQEARSGIQHNSLMRYGYSDGGGIATS